MSYLSRAFICAELAKVRYKPGFAFTAYEHPVEGLIVAIEFEVPDSYRHGEQQVQCVNVPVPPLVSVEHFHDWLFWRLRTIELHELAEFYRVGSELRFDPHTEAYWRLGRS